MKKLSILLAFYVVVSKQDFYEVRHDSNSSIVVTDKAMADDLANALNEAHKRIEEKLEMEKWSKPQQFINDRDACGQDDCGEDPK